MCGDEGFAHLGVDATDQFAVGGVAGFNGDQVSMDRPAEQCEVTDDVEDFVANEFVGITKGFVGENGIFADDDSIFEATAFDETVFDEIFDFFEEAEGAGVGDIAFPRIRSNFKAAKLGEPALFVGAGAGDLENFVGEKGHDGFAHFQFDRGGDGVGFATLFLGDNSGGFDQFAVFASAAVGDGRLVGIELDDGIVDSVAGKGGEDVFDGVDAGVAFGEGSGAVVLDDIFDAGFDFGFALEVDAAEADARIRGRRQKGHGHPVATVKADAGVTG